MADPTPQAISQQLAALDAQTRAKLQAGGYLPQGFGAPPQQIDLAPVAINSALPPAQQAPVDTTPTGDANGFAWVGRGPPTGTPGGPGWVNVGGPKVAADEVAPALSAPPSTGGGGGPVEANAAVGAAPRVKEAIPLPAVEAKDIQAKPAGPAQPGLDPGLPPRPTGAGGVSPNLKALLGQFDESDRRVIKANEGQQAKVGGAAQAAEDLAWRTQAANANAVAEYGNIGQQQLAHNQRATDSAYKAWDDAKAQAASLKDIDPDHYWHEKGTGARIGSAIAVALGAFGAAMPHSGAGGRNYAQEIVNSAIENDIKAQQMNLDKKWKEATLGHDIANNKLARSQWESDQLDKAMLHANEKGRLEVAGAAAQYQGAEQQAKLGEIDAGLTAKNEQIVQQMAQRRFQALQQAAAGAGGDAQLRAGIKKAADEYFSERVKNGGAPPTAQELASAYGGRGVPGGVGPSVDPLAGIPKQNREAAQKELDKITGQKTDLAALDRVGEGLQGNRPTEHPLDYLAAGIADTEGAKKRERIEAYNAQILSLLKKDEGLRLNPTVLEQVAKPMLLDESASQATIERAKDRAKAHFAPTPQTPILVNAGKVAPPQQGIPGLKALP
jgi:hypothetical protein